MGESDGGEKERRGKENIPEGRGPQEDDEQTKSSEVVRKEDGRRGWEDWSENERWPLKAIREGPLTVSRIYEEANTYSTTASTITRQLTVAGFAIAWLFHETIKGVRVDTIRLPAVLWPSLVLFTATGFLDLCQYTNESTIHGAAVGKIGALGLEESDRVDLVSGVHATATKLFEWKRRTLIAAYALLAGAVMWLLR